MLEIVDLNFKTRCVRQYALARTNADDWVWLECYCMIVGIAAGRAAQRARSRARIEMRNLLKRLGQMGKTIIVSSHILPELADICI